MLIDEYQEEKQTDFRIAKGNNCTIELSRTKNQGSKQACKSNINSAMWQSRSFGDGI